MVVKLSCNERAETGAGDRGDPMNPDDHSPLAAVAEFGRVALVDQDLPMLLKQAAALVARELRVELSSLLELQPDGTALFRAGVGWREGIVGQATVELGGQSASGHVIRSQRPLVIGDVAADRRFRVSPLLEEHGVAGCLLVPLHGRQRPLGVLGALSRSPRQFTDDEAAWLQIVANALSHPIERQWLPEQQGNQQLLRAEQMMAIGQVAAGVAHELRNPLTSIKGLVQVNLREQAARGLPVDDLSVIEHEIRRMEKTLQTFLDFARPPAPDRRLQDLSPIVERVLSLVGGRAGKQNVTLRFERPARPIVAHVDQDQIQQLVLNLVLNALDAMPIGGAIDVELQPPRDGNITLQVRDTGPGIAPQILPKVFESFVSNKETGVGLGLPLSRRIAEEHGGSLTAYNLPVAGACFILRLPAEPHPAA